MNRDFWLNRWQENRIGFHLSEVQPLLLRFHDEIAPAGGRVLVPLCGKSLDLKWLADRGHDVVGVDLSPLAAEAFMTEQHLSAVMSSEPPFTILRAGHITFYVGDFFSLQADRTGQFDLIYDRAALIALPAEMRKGYVERLRTLLNPQGRLLLVSIEYDAGAMNGPPFAVTEDEVRNLFAGFSVNKLIEYDCIESEPQFKARGLQWLKEAAYKIHST